MIVSDSLFMFGIGLACGIPLAFLVARFLSSELYQLGYVDVISFALAMAVVFLVAIASALIPARVAAKVDPLVALRYE
jgi:ABC-type antimicrobial peptide transport system permease subunit